MGDVLQVFAIGEWGLSKGQVAALSTLTLNPTPNPNPNPTPTPTPNQVATFFTAIPVLGALGYL